MACSSGPDIIQDGLVLCLDAASERSYPGTGTTWTDLKGGNNGTFNNMTASSFSSDNAGILSFDGGDDYVEFSDGMIDANQDWTLSTFINLSGSQTSTIIGSAGGQSLQVRIDGATSGYWAGHWQVLHSTIIGVARFTNFGPRGSSDRSLGVWYNITITKSSYTYSLYIDGEFNQSVTDGDEVTFNNDPNVIGARQRTNELFNGKIANLFFYNRVLNAAEIRQNYLSTKERFA